MDYSRQTEVWTFCCPYQYWCEKEVYWDGEYSHVDYVYPTSEVFWDSYFTYWDVDRAFEEAYGSEDDSDDEDGSAGDVEPRGAGEDEFLKIDQDGDGSILKSEFIAHFGYEDWVREIFHEMDTDGDGLVTDCEWKVWAAYEYQWI